MDSIPGTRRTNTTNHTFHPEAHSYWGTDRQAHKKNTNPDPRPTTSLSDRRDAHVATGHRANVPNRSCERPHAKCVGLEERMCRSCEDGHGHRGHYDRSHAMTGWGDRQGDLSCHVRLQNHANEHLPDLAAFRLSCPDDVEQDPDLTVRPRPKLQ